MKSYSFIAFCFAAITAASPIMAALVETLDNGLQVIVRENHTAPVADVRIYVRAGSIHEQEYLGTGISHVFEHLINGGTTRNHSEREISDMIDRLGGANNAYTSKDHTCYFITTAANMVTDAIDLLADWMINSSFPENEFRREMGVVLEELRKSEEEPHRILYQTLDETVFLQHPVRYPVIGYEELIASLTHDDIITYYKRMYVPNNMVIAVVGDFDSNRILAHIRSAFANFRRGTPPAVSLPDEPRQMGKRMRTVYKDGLGETYFKIAWRTVMIDHPDLFPLDVLSFIMTHGRSSRLIRTLREEKRLVSSIYSYSHTPAYDAGVYVIGGTCKDENVDEVLKEISHELERFRREPVSADELEKAIKQKVAADIMGNQTASAEAGELGRNMVMTGNPNFNDVYIAGIRTVTVDDIRRVANDYFRNDNESVALLRPKSIGDGEQEPVAGETAAPIRKEVLANGMTVLVRRNANIPIVNIQALFIGGVLYEPAGLTGISKITAEMLTRGTTSRSRDDIATAFDSVGGQYSSSSGNNTFGLSAEVLKEDFDLALEIVADLILNPTFPEDELRTVKENTISAIARRYDSWDSEIGYLFRKAYFREHPYGNDANGETETVQAIEHEDVVDFYRQFAVPRRCIVTVFGDIDEDAVIKAVNHRLGMFERVAAPLPEVQAYPGPSGNDIKMIEVSKSLSAVYIGYPGIRVTNTADRYPLIVLDTILSGYGYPGGRLYEHLRGQENDLVYLVHAFNFMGLHPGYFGITAASSPEKMDRVVEIILEDVNSIRASLVGADELAKAKAICDTMEKLSRQTNGSMALQAAVEELYGLGYDHSETDMERIHAVTADDVLRVARKYLTHYVMVRTKPAKVAE